MGTYLLHPNGPNMLHHKYRIHYHNYHVLDCYQHPDILSFPIREGLDKKKRYEVQVQGIFNLPYYSGLKTDSIFTYQEKTGAFTSFKT